MTDFNEYILRKWAKAIRLRDENQCQMCERIGGPLEVHHIYAKAVYPDKAYLLKNGITLCFTCHRAIVHAGNTFDPNNWRKFIVMFNYLMTLARNRHFNNKYQDRIS